MSGQAGHHEIARRYALAFFELAKELHQIEQVSLDLRMLKAMITESADFSRFLHNATLRRTEEAQVVTFLADKMKFADLTKKFLGTLALNRRLDLLAMIVTAAKGEISRHKGEINAEVTSAVALDTATASSIAAVLKKALGKAVNVVLKQDADIMGGLIIQVGSQRIDSSVRSKLDRLHRMLKNPNTSRDKTKMREVA